MARDLVRELESYGGDPSNLVMSGEFHKTVSRPTTESIAVGVSTRAPRSNSSGSSAGGEMPSSSQRLEQLQPHRHGLQRACRLI